MTGMLKSVASWNGIRTLKAFAEPTAAEMQSILAQAGNVGLRVGTPDDAAAVVRLFAAGHGDRGTLSDLAWAVKMGGSVPDAVAKVLAKRQPAAGGARSMLPGQPLPTLTGD